MMQVELRIIDRSDLRKIFDWRNSTEVRRGMFDKSELNWEEHNRYWENILKDRNVLKFIISAGTEDCGVVKVNLDVNRSEGEIDIFIAPSFHGRGIATISMTQLLEKLKEKDIKKIIARVRSDNSASARMFEKAGFKKVFYQYEYLVGSEGI